MKKSAPAASTYIWQQPGWPGLRFDEQVLAPRVDAARLAQGRLLGQLEAIGLAERSELERDLWVQEAVATAAIEGERMDLGSVRSSVCRRLGLAAAKSHDRRVEGLIDVQHDAVRSHAEPLTEDRLCRWQSALFPGGTASIRRVTVGRYRDHAEAMQIVSGLPGRELVHYTAPPSSRVRPEMRRFLAWFERTRPARGPAAARSTGRHPPINGLARAALAHLWFETIHPFEDGNGRLGRAIIDMAIVQDIDSSSHGLGLSRLLLDRRTEYYDALNSAQRGTLDVTDWMVWFMTAFRLSCEHAQSMVLDARARSAFWRSASVFALTDRQRKVLTRLVEAGNGGFLGGLTADKYVKLTGVSKATATRDLSELLAHGLLNVSGTGRATRYTVAVEGWAPASAMAPSTPG